jgi:hypothetical protein
LKTPRIYPIFARQGRSWRRYKVGYIDCEGSVVVQPRFDHGLPCSEGLAAIAVGGKWGFINTVGAEAIRPCFDKAYYFSESRASVVLGKRGYVDPSGRLVIAPRYSLGGDFRQGLAYVEQKNQYGFVNPEGAEVIPLSFEDAREFSEGLAAVKAQGRWGYVNSRGFFAIAPQFQDPVAGRFKGGLARVCTGGRFGLTALSENSTGGHF